MAHLGYKYAWAGSCTYGCDWGGNLYDPVSGNKVRDASSSSTDGYISGLYIGTYLNQGVRVYAGDLIVLVHTIASTTSSGLGQPSNFFTPWQPLLKTNGQPFNETATCANGGIRVRMWYKWATVDDAASTKLYLITNSFYAAAGMGVRIFPGYAFATDPAGDSDYGNLSPAPYVPVAAAVRTGSGGNPTNPTISTPNVGSAYRNIGVFGTVVSTLNSDKSFQKTQADYDSDNASYAAAGWVESPVSPGFLYPLAGASSSPNGVDTYFGVANVTLDGRATPKLYDYTYAPNVAKFNDAFISATLSIIQPYRFPTPTPGKSWADVADTFDATETLSSKYFLGTTRSDQALPSITSDGQLRLQAAQVLYAKNRIDITSKALVVGPIDYDATAPGTNLGIALTTDYYGIHTARIEMYTVPSAAGATIRWRITDDSFITPIPGEALGDVAVWNPVATRYWRIRESAGVLNFDVSPDKIRWTGATYGSNMLPDQRSAMRVLIYILGSSGPDAKIDAINPVTPPDTRAIPYDTTFTFMGAPTELREKYHGRDVLVGISDQGTTAAVRAAQNVTMLKRNYIVGTPPEGKEIFDFATHGCLVTPCAVPTGGKFVEAVISGTDGTSSASLIMAGILWCARQGAKTINLSFGGGGDEAVFDQVFAYIAANFDVEIFIAAGNEYAYSIDYPAVYSLRYANVHSVIAWDEITNTRPSFSNHHELATGCAPGNYVGGRLPSGDPVLWRGTSAASPDAMQMCVRLLTGGRFTANQAGVALVRNLRPTGQPNTEQGGGAFDLSRAIRTLGDPVGTTNLPAVAMPRFAYGQYEGVADGINQMIAEVERQGMLCLARYTGATYTSDGKLEYVPTTITSGLYGVLPWDTIDIDSYGGMVAGATITIPADGLYLVCLQVRYGTRIIDTSTGLYTTATGAPYNAGQRFAAIMLNGSDLLANGVAVERKTAVIDGEGVTVSITALVPLFQNDFVYAQTWQSSGSTIQCLQNDYGGNWMLVGRFSPLAPAQVGIVGPVTNLVATALSYSKVRLTWVPPTGQYTQSIVRRNVGTVAPTSITDGTFLGAVPTAQGATYVDVDLTGSTTYTYTVFARGPLQYATGVSVTVTTPVKPTAPAPVTNITSTRRTTAEIKLAWTVPPNPDAGGVTRAGIMVRRNQGGVAPTTSYGGVLIADLPPDATGYTDTDVIPSGQLYAYSIFTYRAEEVYSTPATHVRSTATNVSMFGLVRPGSVYPAGTFAKPYTPPDSFGLQLPLPAGVKDYSPIVYGVYFYVTRPALAKGVRFLRARANIGRVTGALYRNHYYRDLGIYRMSEEVPFSTTGSYLNWEDAIFSSYVPLEPYVIYMTCVFHPTYSPECQYPTFWTGSDFGSNGLADATGLLVYPNNTTGWPTGQQRYQGYFWQPDDVYYNDGLTPTLPDAYAGGWGTCDVIINDNS